MSRGEAPRIWNQQPARGDGPEISIRRCYPGECPKRRYVRAPFRLTGGQYQRFRLGRRMGLLHFFVRSLIEDVVVLLKGGPTEEAKSDGDGEGGGYEAHAAR